MNEEQVAYHKWYIVKGPAGATVTNEDGSIVHCTIPEGGQGCFYATDTVVYKSDAAVELHEVVNFKCAPAIGSGSGGGSKVTFDEVPTEGSGNAVTSGGLYVRIINPINLGNNAVTYGNCIAIGNGITCSSKAGYPIAIGQAVKVGANCDGGIAIGYSSELKSNSYQSVAIGQSASVSSYGVAIGHTTSTSFYGTAVGDKCSATNHAAAFGMKVNAKDVGCTVIGAWNGNATAWGAPTVQTLLYLMAAGSPLATTYENGEACLGYVVKDTSGNVQACGTRKLSELLTNNTAFAPAAMDLDADPPTPFLPTGATEPIEFPEPEAYVEFSF